MKKNSIPGEFKERFLESKGFLPEIIVNDYPLRDKIVKLYVKKEDGLIRHQEKSFREIGIL
ncbi:hypothetical protein EGI15_05670 [Chryseobacterium cucumeris]|uniref:Uncharacterized protein n=1 Tax=Chryseobacterium cucumeris TaxID=1813611 RepID=A0ABX9XCP1_9FLAO|nr:hypothetical protein EGI15_05670 [Chryseobacterium cucumeris]